MLWLDQVQPHRPLDRPGSPQLRLRPRRGGAPLPVPRPGPRHQVHRQFRHRARLYRHRDDTSSSRLAEGERLRSPNGSCGPSAKTASTTSSSYDDILRPCSPSTYAIATKPGLTAVSVSTNRSPARRPRPPVTARSSVAMSLAASSTNTSALPDTSPSVLPTMARVHVVPPLSPQAGHWGGSQC